MWFTNFVGCNQLWLWFYTNIVNIDTPKSSTTMIRHPLKKYVRDVRREDTQRNAKNICIYLVHN